MKGFIDKVAMVQSKQEFNRKQHSPIVRHQSPFRNYQNVNSMNTIIQSPKARKSLSPIRGRIKTQKLTTTQNQKRKCQNHHNKEGTYFVDSERETLYYCRNCAVRLASQGFQIKLLGSVQEMDSSKNKDISGKIEQLKGVMNGLFSKKTMMDKIIAKGDHSFKFQIEKVKNYYSQVYQMLREHENRVIEQIKIEYQNACGITRELKNKVEEAIVTGQKIKKDFDLCLTDQYSSIANTEAYDSFMNKFRQKMAEYKYMINDKLYEKEIPVKTLSFKDPEEVCEIIIENMQLQWNIEKQELNIEKSFEKLLSQKKQKKLNVLGSF